MLSLFQFGFAIMGLLFSTIAAWYEGSALLDDRWDWNYSTPFSHLFNGQIIDHNHISQLDYFVYAAKFHPAFPVIMQIFGLYLFILIGYSFLKNHLKGFSYYLGILGAGLFLFCFFILHSSTHGGQVLLTSSFLSGFVCLLLAVIFYDRIKNHRNCRGNL